MNQGAIPSRIITNNYAYFITIGTSVLTHTMINKSVIVSRSNFDEPTGRTD